jgi:hypothetical protein
MDAVVKRSNKKDGTLPQTSQHNHQQTSSHNPENSTPSSDRPNLLTFLKNLLPITQRPMATIAYSILKVGVAGKGHGA